MFWIGLLVGLACCLVAFCVWSSIPRKTQEVFDDILNDTDEEEPLEGPKESDENGSALIENDSEGSFEPISEETEPFGLKKPGNERSPLHDELQFLRKEKERFEMERDWFDMERKKRDKEFGRILELYAQSQEERRKLEHSLHELEDIKQFLRSTIVCQRDLSSGNCPDLPVSPSDSSIEDSTVYSALYAPASVELSHWFKIQVHLYTREEARLSEQKARVLDRKAEKHDFNPLALKLESGMRIRADLSVFDEGVQIQKPVRYLVWDGEMISAVFMVKVTDSSLMNAVGEVVLSVEGVPVGVLSFVVDISSAPVVIDQYQIGSAKPFKKPFISYSHEDVKIATAVAAGFRAQNIPYFLDQHSLESGAVFNEEIERNIEESDLFLLLWSKHAAESEFVEKEYLHALQFAYPQKDRDSATLSFRPFFIDPVADPPAKLKGIYNFSRL